MRYKLLLIVVMPLMHISVSYAQVTPNRRTRIQNEQPKVVQNPQTQQKQEEILSLFNKLVETYYEYYSDDNNIAEKIDELCGDNQQYKTQITNAFIRWLGDKKAVKDRINELYRRHPDISIADINEVVKKSRIQKGDEDYDYIQDLISTIAIKPIKESLLKKDSRQLDIFNNVIYDETAKDETAKDETVLKEDKYTLSYTNDWSETYKAWEYKVIRYSDGTTKVYDPDNNWMQFKTEYVKNEFTGENTSNLIDGFKYVDGSITPTLLASKKAIPNGYTLYVNGNEISMHTPLGITYVTKRNSVSSKMWSDEWRSPSSFDLNLNHYFKENGTILKGPGGNELVDMTTIQFKDIAGNPIHGGYYDEKGMRMYYALGALENTPLCLVTLQFCMQPCLIDGEVRLLYSLPSDIISNINSDENKIEINYTNGDYLKMSKLKSGIVYDCIMHRPNGIWKVKVDDEGNIISDFEYTQGIYKGLIYKGKFLNDQYAQCLACHDMINRSMMKDNGYYPLLYEPSTNRFLNVRPDGKIKEYIEEERERRLREEGAEEAKQIQATRAAFAKKYGQEVQKSLDNLKIPVGMPISALTEYRNGHGSQIYKCIVSDDGGNVKRYEVNALIMVWGKFASVWTSAGKVTSVHYYSY